MYGWVGVGEGVWEGLTNAVVRRIRVEARM